jgi:AraC-like DNA-binding protein
MGESVIEGRKHIIKATNYLMIPAWMKHSYQSDKKQPWTIFWMHFRGSNANVISDILYKNMLNAGNSVLMSEKHKDLFYTILSNLQKGYGYDNMMQLTIILHEYLSHFLFPDSKSIQEKEIKENMIDLIVGYLKENIHKPLTLNEIATVANYSPTHFSSKFKKMTGYSPLEYFNHLKLQKACHMLRFTQLRIGEIADAIGISDPYYFSRLFKNHLGVSPKEFRSSKQMEQTEM